MAEIGVHCPNRIEIDAQLEFDSEDGVFAELFDVVVSVDMDEFEYSGELGLARIHEPFDPSSHIATFNGWNIY